MQHIVAKIDQNSVFFQKNLQVQQTVASTVRTAEPSMGLETPTNSARKTCLSLDRLTNQWSLGQTTVRSP